MFEDSLLESGGRNSKLHRRGPWATVLSFVLQAALVGVLVLIPLIYTEALPKQQLMGYLVAPPPPPPPPPPPAAAPVVKVVKPYDGNRQWATQGSHRDSQEDRDDQGRAKPRPAMVSVGGVVGGVPGGQLAVSLAAFWAPSFSLLPRPCPRRPPRSVLRFPPASRQGLLVRKVQPTYPPLAKQARISGSVVLQAVIGKDGSIENLHAVSGHPMLIQSAIDAVRQWKYKPYFLNGEPVEVDTQVTVNFTLAGG